MGKYTATSNWNFRLSVSPSPAQIAKLFGETSGDFNDYRPAWGRCAPKVMAGIKRIMDGKGAPMGQPWPGLRDKHYLARKARMGWSSAEMFASYRLAQSIGVVSMTKKALRVGTDLKYARALQWGRAGKNRPRMFIGLDQTAQQQCVEELNAHVNKALDKLAQRISSDKSEAA